MKPTTLIVGVLMTLSLLNLHPSVGAPARARVIQPARKPALRSLKTLYITRLTGDPVFTSRLKREIQRMGLRFVNTRSAADALLDGFGNYNKGEFRGRITLRARNGQVLWRGDAFRPRNSDYMAYARLADKLRAALRGK